MTMYRTAVFLSAPLLVAQTTIAQPYAVTWFSIDGGGSTTPSVGGVYTVAGTVGQPDASSTLSGGVYGCIGGFWVAALSPVCYANCDGSTVSPVLTANDFQCFLNKFATGCT
jgi:hypothetical protein